MNARNKQILWGILLGFFLMWLYRSHQARKGA